MIFVTVGTHEQPFNRLLKEIDKLVADSIIQERVIIQTGYSDYIPKNCEWHKFLSLQEMTENIEKARIVITHGGPASFIAPLQINKIPIVVPRQEKYGEHINNHQIDFVKLISNRLNNIIPVYNIQDLREKIMNYDKISNSDSNQIKSNNINFNEQFEKIVSTLFKE